MRVNEIFYSLQGEGFWTGTPAVFVRFSGCNLACEFCDTDHSGHVDMTEEEILRQILRYPARRVVFTGGEPLLQLNERLLRLMSDNGIKVHVETNGTVAVDPAVGSLIDWVTVSPKKSEVALSKIDELKVVYQGQDLSHWESAVPASRCRWRYLQPCDYGDAARNAESIRLTVDYVKAHPQWALSLQTHKLIDIP